MRDPRESRPCRSPRSHGTRSVQRGPTHAYRKDTLHPRPNGLLLSLDAAPCERRIAVFRSQWLASGFLAPAANCTGHPGGRTPVAPVTLSP